MRLILPALIALSSSAAWGQAPGRPAARLKLLEYVGDTTSFNVVSTVIVGPTEAILVDGQMTMSGGRGAADLVASTGRRLKCIFITHPDEDHTFGLQAVLSRFPGTPVYITAAGAKVFAEIAPKYLGSMRQYLGRDAPDSVVTLQVLPSNHLSVDGEAVEVVPDLQGDVMARTNSFLFIPSLRAVVAGDIVFAGVHPYLAGSTPETRQAWLRSLDSIEARAPRILVPGHKPSVDYPDSPKAIRFMAEYLRVFDETRGRVADANGLVEALQSKYPTLRQPRLLRMSARRAFAPKPPGT